MYQTKGPVTKKLSNYLSNYYAEESATPKNDSDYQLTTEAFMNRIAQHKQNTFNKYRSGVSSMRKEVTDLEASIRIKERYTFYPNSNHYDDKVKDQAKQQRQMALQKISSGKINVTGLLKEIEDNFLNNNVDANSEYYNYLLTHDLQGIGMQSQMDLISKLKSGYGKNLQEIKELKSDLRTAQGELQTLDKTFKIN